VVRLIEILSEGKSINKNDVPTKVIKLSKFVLALVLTRIFHKCLNESFYPDCLKVAEVIPICKSGEQNICSKYRPISILLQFNKYLKECYMTECTFIHWNISHYPNINLFQA